MPFGIPASEARTHAVDDFCNATTDQLEQLIAEVIGPICQYADEAEGKADTISALVQKSLSKQAGTISRRVSTLSKEPDTVIGPLSQQLQQYLDAKYAELGIDESALPQFTAAQAPQPLGAFASVKPKCDTLTDDDIARIRQTLAKNPEQLSDDDISLIFACQPPFTKADQARILLRARPSLRPEEHPLEIVPPATTPPKPEPKPPELTSGFPCPALPPGFTRLGGIVGTPEWCQHAEQLLAALEGLGSQLVQWAQTNIDPTELGSLEPWTHFDEEQSSPQWVARVLNVLRDLIMKAFKFAGKAALWIMDAIRCVGYWSTALVPIRRPEAYVSILVMRNAVAWIRDSRIGSQSYLGLTVGLSLTLPQLEAYLDRLLDYLAPVEIPGIPEIGEAFVAGFIERSQYECLMSLNGMSSDLFEPFLRARGERLRTEEAIQFARRANLSEEDTIALLRRAGWYDLDAAKNRVVLYDELPSVADHLHWMQRNVFDKEYADKYQLDAGFEERFWKTFGHDLTAQGYTHDRARYEYMAHWVQPSPQQMQEFVYRLRPGRVEGGPAFTVDDYQRILVEQDYSPLARQWFAATVYKVPALTYLRDMHRMGLLSDAEMKEYHADLGYKPKDSDLFVKVDSFRRQRMRASQGSGWSPAALRKAFAIGQVDEALVRQKMEGMGFQPQDSLDLMDRAKADLQYRVLSRSYSQQLTTTIRQVREAVRVGVMEDSSATDALVDLGWNRDKARSIIQLEIASAKTARIKAAIQRVRHAFTVGEVNEDAARESLTTLGLTATSIDDYLAVWKVELTPGRKRRTAQEIVKDVAEHIMDETEARARLDNLGYKEADILLFLADAARQTVESQEALQYLQTLGGKDQGQKLTELGEHTVGLSKRIVKQLKEQQPPAKLQKWVKQGLITADAAKRRLRLYGWDEDSIALWIAQVQTEAIGEEQEG